jgi:hypothetical protein
MWATDFDISLHQTNGVPQDHRVLKEGFNELHAKYRNSVGEVAALQAQLQASQNECADLQRRIQDAEQVRMSREDTEAALNVSIPLRARFIRKLIVSRESLKT